MFGGLCRDVSGVHVGWGVNTQKMPFPSVKTAFFAGEEVPADEAQKMLRKQTKTTP